MVLFLKHEHKKWDLIFVSTYQNEDKSHAIFLHSLHQQTKVLKSGAEGEVQLPVHVIDVYMLNILQEGQASCWGSCNSNLRAHILFCQAPGLMLVDLSPSPSKFTSLLPYTHLSILLIKFAIWFLHTDHLFPFLLLLPLPHIHTGILSPFLASIHVYPLFKSQTWWAYKKKC